MSTEATARPEVAVLCRTIAAALQCTYADDTGGGDGDDGGGGGSSALMAKFLAMRAKMDVRCTPSIRTAAACYRPHSAHLAVK